ncbi:MAG: hypothetical protein QNJ47_23795 [Nostocaceae cyanobacterium]|nr:hypothetical protein [Nostocaceae cyanobacterium]
MFILKSDDVQISSIQHPKRDQLVPILYYQGQSFRLITVFPISQEEEAIALWRDFTDNRGKACVLVEEANRFSIWGKIRLEQLDADTEENHQYAEILFQGSILLLQALYIDIEDLLGSRQASLFAKEIASLLQKFPQTSSKEAVEKFLHGDTRETANLLTWKEKHVIAFLQEVHRLGKLYFGNNSFAYQVADKLEVMADEERSLFISWLVQSPLNKLWQ